MVGARAAVVVVPAAIYFFSYFHRVAPAVVATDLTKAFPSRRRPSARSPIFLGFAVLQWLAGAILDAKWTGLEADGARIYSENGYRAIFVVCLALAAGSLVMTLLVTETRCRNLWRRAAH